MDRVDSGGVVVVDAEEDVVDVVDVCKEDACDEDVCEGRVGSVVEVVDDSSFVEVVVAPVVDCS